MPCSCTPYSRTFYSFRVGDELAVFPLHLEKILIRYPLLEFLDLHYKKQPSNLLLGRLNPPHHFPSTRYFFSLRRRLSLCGQHHRALKLFLQCGKQEVEAAIAVVGKARNDMLTHTLIDFLMGETDGVPKDPNYIYRLYMALGSYSQV